MSDNGPEQDRLAKRLFENPDRKTLNFNIFPGDNPGTAEQLCAEVNKAMDEIERFQALPVEEQMRREIRRVYERLSRAIRLCQFDIKDWDKPVNDARKRLGDIFCELDMSLMTLGNWIDNDDRREIKQRVRYPAGEASGLSDDRLVQPQSLGCGEP